MEILMQIGIVFGVCLVGKSISTILPITFPESVISMILLFLLLLFNVLKVHHIKEKANFLLKNMAFFFIPAGVGIMNNFKVIQGSILQLLIVCIVTTILTFGATALTVKSVIALQNKLSVVKINNEVNDITLNNNIREVE